MNIMTPIARRDSEATRGSEVNVRNLCCYITSTVLLFTINLPVTAIIWTAVAFRPTTGLVSVATVTTALFLLGHGMLVGAWCWTTVPHKVTHIGAYLAVQMTLIGWNVIQLIYLSNMADQIYEERREADSEQLRQVEEVVIVVIVVVCVSVVLGALAPCLVWCLSSCPGLVCTGLCIRIRRMWRLSKTVSVDRAQATLQSTYTSL